MTGTKLSNDLWWANHERDEAKLLEICASVSPTVLSDARDVVAYANDLLRPDMKAEKMGHVSAMLAHYFTPDRTHDENLLIAAQWAEVLREYPTWVVAEACLVWIRRDRKGRRPVPGQIVALCNSVTFPLREASRNATALLEAAKKMQDVRAIAPRADLPFEMPKLREMEGVR